MLRPALTLSGPLRIIPGALSHSLLASGGDRRMGRRRNIYRAIPHNSKCRYGERGAADAKPKAQIILDAAKVSAASGGCNEPKQGQRSQSARGFCPQSTMRGPQPDIIEHFGNADAVPQPPERCLSRKAGIVRCCYRTKRKRQSCEMDGWIYQSMEIVWAVGCGFTYLGRVIASTPLL